MVADADGDAEAEADAPAVPAAAADDVAVVAEPSRAVAADDGDATGGVVGGTVDGGVPADDVVAAVVPQPAAPVRAIRVSI
ncbi:hypothetical protein GCM10009828_008220 [Actinoplanes couchii]|uniref:Uncharacterized protein n=1 Tax=Actinoplanes couchii TaxID=403638 RepID=A0ABQ3XPC8_9ACTN|nr:hypothetical protein Aco03nite_087370 [Actinoplanes couchii]